jgi:TonB family protein
MKKLFLVLFCLILAQISFAQPDRGVGVKVKDRNGNEREFKLYKASYALVIGNSNYKYWDVLNGVKSDVTAVEKALKINGFTVETAMDLDSRNLSQRIEKFIQDYGYEENNRLLIYYAGHGSTQKSISSGDDREIGYIVPVDAPLPNKDNIGFLRASVNLEKIRTFAKEIQAKHALFLFDSCFSGRLVSRGEISVPPIIEESVSFPVRQFITAGAANQTVPDESIFRRSFIRGLEGEADLNKDGYVLASELANYLRDRVTNYSDRRQTPLYAKIDDVNLDRGDFVFTVSKVSAPVETTATVQPQPTPPPTSESNSSAPLSSSQPAKPVSQGVLNGKAKNLVQPEYPKAARAVRVSDTVNVQVTIDENGNVISATAISGHALLHPAAIEAAKASTFDPTFFEGKRVKVTGVIVYKFTP